MIYDTSFVAPGRRRSGHSFGGRGVRSGRQWGEKRFTFRQFRIHLRWVKGENADSSAVATSSLWSRQRKTPLDKA